MISSLQLSAATKLSLWRVPLSGPPSRPDLCPQLKGRSPTSGQSVSGPAQGTDSSALLSVKFKHENT